MNNYYSKSSTKKLDEEFPPLSSLPKKNPSGSVQASHYSSQPIKSVQPAQSSSGTAPNLSSVVAADAFTSSDTRSPKNLYQTELTQQEFCHALASEMDLIQDPPYDSHDIPTPKNPVETPASYPQLKNMKLVHPNFFKKYDLMTLFFIFFYSPGSSQQYFAALELHNRNWKYHRQYQSWFHKVEEPKELGNEHDAPIFQYLDRSTTEDWDVRERKIPNLDENMLV